MAPGQRGLLLLVLEASPFPVALSGPPRPPYLPTSRAIP